MLCRRNVSNNFAVPFPAYFRWIIILMNNLATFFHVAIILISSSVVSTLLYSESISNSFTNRYSGCCVALKVSFSQFLKSVERVYLQQLKVDAVITISERWLFTVRIIGHKAGCMTYNLYVCDLYWDKAVRAMAKVCFTRAA